MYEQPTKGQLETYSEALDKANKAVGTLFPQVVESQYDIASSLITIMLGASDSLDPIWRRKLERKYPTAEDKVDAIRKGGKMVAKKAKALVKQNLNKRIRSSMYSEGHLVVENDVEPLITMHSILFDEDI